MIDLKQYKLPLTKFRGGCNPINVFEIDNTKFIFKETNPLSEKLHITEPLVSQYLATSPCKNFVPYYSAQYDKKTGVISKSFLEENDKEIKYLEILEFIYANNHNSKKELDYKFPYEDFKVFNDDYEKNRKKMYFLHSVPEILKNIKSFCEIYNISFNDKQLKQSLTEMCVYDYFLGNEDRNWNNLSFVLKNNNGKMFLEQSPLYDHEYCLNMYYYYDKFMGKETYKYKSDWNLHNSLKPHLLPNKKNIDWSQRKKLFANDIIEEAEHNIDVKKQVDFCLNFDAQTFLEKFEKEENIKLDEEYKEIVLYSFNSKIDNYKKTKNQKNIYFFN